MSVTYVSLNENQAVVKMDHALRQILVSPATAVLNSKWKTELLAFTKITAADLSKSDVTVALVKEKVNPVIHESFRKTPNLLTKLA